MSYQSQVDTIMWQPYIHGCPDMRCREYCYIYKGKVEELKSSSPDFDSHPPPIREKVETILSFNPKQIILSVQPDSCINDIIQEFYNQGARKLLDLTAPSIYDIEIPAGCKEAIHTISLSSLPVGQARTIRVTDFRREGIILNLNLLSFQADVTFEELHLYSLFNSIHLLLKKPPLGEEITQQDRVNYIDAWDKLIAQGLSTSQLKRDRCMSCYYNQIMEQSCSAGIRQVHIWPSGVVTGCPYDTNLLYPHHESTLRESLESCLSSGAFSPWWGCSLSDKQQEKKKRKSLLQRIIEE